MNYGLGVEIIGFCAGIAISNTDPYGRKSRYLFLFFIFMMSTHDHSHKETLQRSLIKTISYRLLIIALDFTAIYFFTGKAKIAFGFMIVSNIYTTIGYFFHERIRDTIKRGKKIEKHRVG